MMENNSKSPYSMIRLLAAWFRVLGILGLIGAAILLFVFMITVFSQPRGTPMIGILPLMLPAAMVMLWAIGLLAMSEILMLLVRAVEYLKRIEENTRGLPLPPQR
jgi:hypothetical protein